MIKSKRVKVDGTRAVYHCMSRTVNGEVLFGDRDKEMLRRMIWQVADFCGVRVLTYAVMKNHFHVLVDVPEPEVVGDEELVRRFRRLYPKTSPYQPNTAEELERALRRDDADAAAWRERLLARMGDVSEFMKTLKQRFSVWFNRSHGRFGTLWAERFKSVLVQGRGFPLQAMAAYIDLNAVRAGVVLDPKDYRFCGYAEAMAGRGGARRGLLQIWRDFGNRTVREALSSHRKLLFANGQSPSKPGDSVIDPDRAKRVIEGADGDWMVVAEALRCRMRYFTEGKILGSGLFVASLTDDWQRRRCRKRKPEPKLLDSVGLSGLCVLTANRSRTGR